MRCWAGRCCIARVRVWAQGAPAATPTVTVMEIGNALMGRYVLPLEIVALLLTAAMIGAVIVAMHEKERA